MPKRAAPNLQWIGGDSRSSVWFGLGRLLLPSEFERVEAIRKSRRARLQKAKADASSATEPVEPTGGDNADAEEGQNSEQENQDAAAGPAEEDKTPTDQLANNDASREEPAVDNQEAEQSSETLEPGTEDNGQGN